MTTIKDNWDSKLAEGNKNELEIIELFKNVFPDIDFYKDGKQKEADLCIPSHQTLLEVKYDAMSDETGNFGIEYLWRGNKSGLAATKAHWYIMSDSSNHHIFKSYHLKDFLKLNWQYFKKVKGGDDGDAELILVPKYQLTSAYFCRVVSREGEGLLNLPYFI